MKSRKLFDNLANKRFLILLGFFLTGFLAILIFLNLNQKHGVQKNINETEKTQTCPQKVKIQIPIKVRDESKHSIPLNQILDGGPGKDGIPAINNPCFSKISETDWLEDEDTLLTVKINNETRGYPIRIMNWHEIVNDKFGEEPILITYCPLCGTGIVFERKIGGEEVQFGVSGKLYNSDLLMYDRKTDSLWSQITGEAVVGSLTGEKLKLLAANLISWKEFKTSFPEGLVLTRDTGAGRDYSYNPYEGYEETEETLFSVNNNDKRLPAKERVVGIEINGKFKAYREETLREKVSVEDNFAGSKISLNVGDDGTIMVKNDGQELPYIGSFWFAWVAFHPETQLYK